MEWSAYPPSTLASNSLTAMPATLSKTPPSLSFQSLAPTTSSSSMMKSQDHLTLQPNQHSHQQHAHCIDQNSHNLISDSCFNGSLDLVDNNTSNSTYDEMKFLNVDQYTIEQLKAECILNMDQTLSLDDAEKSEHINLQNSLTQTLSFENLQQPLNQDAGHNHHSIFQHDHMHQEADQFMLPHQCHQQHQHPNMNTSHLQLQNVQQLNNDQLHHHLSSLSMDLPVFGLTGMAPKTPPLLALDKPLSLNISVDGIGDLVDDKF